MTKVFLDDERDPRERLPGMRWSAGRGLFELDQRIWVRTTPEGSRCSRLAA